MAALVQDLRREPAAVWAHSPEAQIALAEEHGPLERLEESRALRAWAMAQLGDREQVPPELETTIAATTGTSLYRVHRVINTYLLVGRADLALDRVNNELARFERSGNGLHLPELHRLEGEA